MDNRFSATGVDAPSAALRGRCPRCGEGRLFDGFVTVRPACERCGQSFAFVDAGDGPAVFVILIAGFLLLGLMLWLQTSYDPPVWLMLLIFMPLTAAVCLGMLRPLKGLLIGLQYRNKAELGRLDK